MTTVPKNRSMKRRSSGSYAGPTSTMQPRISHAMFKLSAAKCARALSNRIWRQQAYAVSGSAVETKPPDWLGSSPGMVTFGGIAGVRAVSNVRMTS